MSANQLFHDGGPCHTETILLICSANHLTDFYIVGTSVMTELIYNDTASEKLHLGISK